MQFAYTKVNGMPGLGGLPVVAAGVGGTVGARNCFAASRIFLRCLNLA
jgi:hypothetical protein